MTYYSTDMVENCLVNWSWNTTKAYDTLQNLSYILIDVCISILRWETASIYLTNRCWIKSITNCVVWFCKMVSPG